MFLTLRQSSFCPIFLPVDSVSLCFVFCYFIEQLNLFSIYLAHGFRFFFVYFQDSSAHLETPFKLNSFCIVWYKRCNLLSHEYRQRMWCNNECLERAKNELRKINISSALKLCGFAALQRTVLDVFKEWTHHSQHKM